MIFELTIENDFLDDYQNDSVYSRLTKRIFDWEYNLKFHNWNNDV